MNTDNWLVLQDIILHSGQHSNFKFECDHLTYDEIKAFAFLIRGMDFFSEVRGIPIGGLRLAEALEDYAEPNGYRRLLIVDDVLTQGTSMECARVDAIREGWNINDIKGAVMFSRGKCPSWVRPVLQLNSWFCS